MKSIMTGFIFFVSLICVIVDSKYTFPDDFIFGAATAAYQIEGAWNKSGKGENIWDKLIHDYPNYIADGSNADIACDSYHKYKEDVAMMSELGLDFYRFSISWARIFPSGQPHRVNSEGVAYYNRLLDELNANKIVPMVTLYHWDLPQSLQDLGGWTNPVLIDCFVEYARVAFENFGDRVKYWTTFNEPPSVCQDGYGENTKAPMLNMSGIADYLCGHNLIKSHAAVYHLYNDTFRPLQNGSIGITINGAWFEPNTTEDIEAAERLIEMSFGWWANPIFSENGDYPLVMKEFIGTKSIKQGYKKSRLPEFSKEEINYIRGTADFLGFNYYTSRKVSHSASENLETSFTNDHQVNVWIDDSWKKTIAPWLVVYAPGLRHYLNWIKERYNNPEIHITENGYSDGGDLYDYERIIYHGKHLEALLEAIYEDNVRIKSYAVWSLMDNFEWMSGYEHRFGLYYVNFTDPKRPRIPKASAVFYKSIINNRSVVDYEGYPTDNKLS